VLLKDLNLEKRLLFGRPDTYAGHWKRVVAMSESADLKDWTELSSVLLPDELDPSEFYYMAPFIYAGLYVGMVAPYRNATSSNMDVQIASSRDAVHWQGPVRRQPSIPLGRLGAFDSHIISNFSPVHRAHPVRKSSPAGYYILPSPSSS
jgi:hypothetical protein